MHNPIVAMQKKVPFWPGRLQPPANVSNCRLLQYFAGIAGNHCIDGNHCWQTKLLPEIPAASNKSILAKSITRAVSVEKKLLQKIILFFRKLVS